MSKKLNILNISMHDIGGAGLAAKKYNALLNQYGFNSKLIVINKHTIDSEIISIENKYITLLKFFLKKGIEYIFINKMKNIFDSKYCFFNTNENAKGFSAKKILSIIPFEPDIIIFHWITRMVNSKTIFEFSRLSNAKLIWYMMDNAPLTGGCHYPWDCIEYQKSCKNCPAVLDDKRKYISENNLATKKKYLPNNLVLISCSEFDYNRAKKSSLFLNKRILKLFFPIDLNKFKPGNKNELKEFCNINPATKVIFFGALSYNDIRKGSKYFIEALDKLQSDFQKEKKDLNKYLIILAGKGRNKLLDNLNFPILEVGHLDENKLIEMYQMSDVFVSTSIEDSGPLMISQAISCGTPIVSFEMGLAYDLVLTGKTGYKAKLKDSYDLANGIKYVFDLDEINYNQLSLNCFNLSRELLSIENHITKLINEVIQ